jgi:hypothetical protein
MLDLLTEAFETEQVDVRGNALDWYLEGKGKVVPVLN